MPESKFINILGRSFLNSKINRDIATIISFVTNKEIYRATAKAQELQDKLRQFLNSSDVNILAVNEQDFDVFFLLAQKLRYQAYFLLSKIAYELNLAPYFNIQCSIFYGLAYAGRATTILEHIKQPAYYNTEVWSNIMAYCAYSRHIIDLKIYRETMERLSLPINWAIIIKFAIKANYLVLAKVLVSESNDPTLSQLLPSTTISPVNPYTEADIETELLKTIKAPLPTPVLAPTLSSTIKTPFPAATVITAMNAKHKIKNLEIIPMRSCPAFLNQKVRLIKKSEFAIPEPLTKIIREQPILLAPRRAQRPTVIA